MNAPVRGRLISGYRVSSLGGLVRVNYIGLLVYTSYCLISQSPVFSLALLLILLLNTTSLSPLLTDIAVLSMYMSEVSDPEESNDP